MESNSTVSLALSKGGKKRTGYASTRARLAILGSTLLTGVCYCLVQWLQTGEIADAWFVGMLTGATAILLHGVKALFDYLVHRGFEYYGFVTPKSDPEQGLRECERLLASAFNVRNMTAAGLLYGLGVGSAPFMLGTWSSSARLRLLLCAFLCSVNFATGVAFYGLVIFFIHSFRLGRLVNVDFWQRQNRAIAFLLGATRRISLLASVYVSVSFSSLLFSVFPVAGLIIVYSIFAVLVILASLVIPAVPIARQTGIAKADALSGIDAQLQAEFTRIIAGLESADENVRLDRLQTLILVREKIDSIRTWPFRLKTVGSAGGIILISSVPVALEFALERLLA